MRVKRFVPDHYSAIHIEPFVARSHREAHSILCSRLLGSGPRTLTVAVEDRMLCTVTASLFDGEDRATDARGRDITERVCK